MGTTIATVHCVQACAAYGESCGDLQIQETAPFCTSLACTFGDPDQTFAGIVLATTSLQ